MGTEAELCDGFAAVIAPHGWVVYPETAGWDLLCVHEPTGAQLGVEAKTRANVAVLRQLVDHLRFRHQRRPRWVAVLVSAAGADFIYLAGMLGADVVFTAEHSRDPYLCLQHVEGWAGLQETLPPIVPRGSGGVPSPAPLTQWRVKALRLCHLLRERGYLTRAEFKAAGVYEALWLKRWLCRAGVGADGSARYVLRAGAVGLPDAGWEAERDELAAIEREV